LDGIQERAGVVFCRSTQQSFLRLLTNAAVLGAHGIPPLTNADAWGAYEAFLSDDRIVFHAQEPAGLNARWRQLALRDTASPKLWMDAYLAAFALAGSLQIVTTDAAFKQFSGLDLVLLKGS
jgi:toxin-antitoxin system PIN domain toxin